MRVLEVTHYMPPHMGGIERVAAALVSGLSRRGHVVRWLSSAIPAANDASGEVRVPAWNILEERVGVPFPIWSPAAFLALDREIHEADVVHVHDCLYMGSAAAAALCTVHHKPMLLTQHVGYVPFGAALDAVQRMAYRTLGRMVLAGADARVACSAHVPDYFVSLGFHGPFTVIPNAIDEAHFHPVSMDERLAARRAWGVGDDARVLLFVGRLVPKKAIARVLEAQRTLAHEGITLVIVGDGPLSEGIKSTPSTVHHPNVPPERMPQLYSLADAFVLPSRGEGLPLSVQEALVSGLPAVVSDDPSYVANLHDAPGVVFTTDDASLIGALRRAVTEPVDRAAIASWAAAQWGGNRFVDSYERVLRELASARKTERV